MQFQSEKEDFATFLTVYVQTLETWVVFTKSFFSNYMYYIKRKKRVLWKHVAFYNILDVLKVKRELRKLLCRTSPLICSTIEYV